MRAGITAAIIVFFAGHASAQIPEFTDREARREAALRTSAEALVPMRDYRQGICSDPDQAMRSDCVRAGHDANHLVAALELDRLGLAGGMTPAGAAPLAMHIAEAAHALVGTEAAQCRCSWDQAGNPSIMYAAQSLGYALHEFGADWPADVKEAIRIATEDTYYGHGYGFAQLANGWINWVIGDLLVGEALGNAALFDRGMTRLRRMYDDMGSAGGLEMNAPVYTSFHFNALIPAQAVDDPEASAMLQILLDYELLLHAHIYLPGGGFGAPQSRDYAGGRVDAPDSAMYDFYWLHLGDPDAPDQETGRIDAVGGWMMPEVIRSIFLDKGDGYTWWGYTKIHQGDSRTRYALYPFGLEGQSVSPWQVVMLPGGDAALGVAYGYRAQPIQVTMGAYLRDPAGGFEILYHQQPAADLRDRTTDLPAHCACPGGGPPCRDTFDDGRGYGGAGMDGDPEDFDNELWDFERMVHGRTLLQIWDPTLADKDPGVVRVCQDTRAAIPLLGRLADGEMRRAGQWRVGRLGDAYVGFLPLGSVGLEEDRGEGSYTFLRLDGVSGSVIELATTADFASLDDFASDLEARHVAFDPDARTLEVDAREPEDGSLTRVRLEYRPERRFVDGVEVSVEDALDHGFMESPWVSWDAEARQLRVQRDCYPGLLYDWDEPSVTEIAPPPECDPMPDGGPSGLDGGAPPPDAGTPIDAATSADAARPPDDGTVDGGCGCVVVRPTFGPTPRRVWLVLATPILLSLTGRGRRRRRGAAGR